MSDVPSNLIPTRLTQLPVAPVADENSLMMIVYQGNNYQIRVGDLLSVAGVPTSTQVIAGTGMTGGGALTGNVTLSIANGGVGSTQLAASGVTSGVYGTATDIPVFTVDSKGRVTAATTTPATISGYVPTSTQVIAGNGLTGGGALSGNVTLAASYSASAPQSGFQTGSAGVANTIARSDHKHPAVDLSADDQVDNILGLGNGGTARSIVPAAGSVIWSGADGLYVTAVGSSGQVLVSNGSGAPSWGSAIIVSDQPANFVYAGPAAGAAAPTAFRALVNADIPSTLTGKSISGATNTLTAIPNVSLDNSAITINGSSVSLGGSVTVTATASSALTISTGLTGTSYNGSAPVTIGIDSTVVTLTGTQTLTGKTMSGASNTFTNIGNGSLSNSSVTIGSDSLSLGGTLTTLNGVSISGSANTLTSIANASLTNSAITIGSTSVSLGGTITTFAGTSISGSTNTLSNIANASLTNSAITINGSSVSLGASVTVTATASNALTIGTGLTGTSYNGSAPVSIAIDSTVATLTGTQTLTNKTIDSATINTPTIATPTLTGGTINNTAIGGTTPAAGAFTSVAMTTGSITTAPTSGNDIVNKDYADAIASGINFHQSCRYATTTALPANIYNNGSSGVGATLTAVVNGALSVDGVAVAATQRILVKNEVAQANNGVYTVTQAGSGILPYILTRASDFDTAGTGVDQIDAGDFFLITAGSTLANTSWVQQTPLPITVGTTALVFLQFGAPLTYSAGTGLSESPAYTFNIANTTVVSGSYGLAASVPTIAINAQGQITSASNTAIAIAATQVTSGVLAIAQGGTNSSATATAGGAVYGTGTAYAFTSAGTAGQVLTSAGASAPTWSGISGGTF
jgi:hypothetical protein